MTTSPDWKLTLEVLVDLAQILGFLVAAAGLVFVGLGYNLWRHQIVENTGHQVARSVLLAAVKVHAEIRGIRGESFLPPPGGPSDVWKDSLLEYPNDPLRPFVEAARNVYAKQLESLAQISAELEVAAMEAGELWPDSGQACISDLLNLSRQLPEALWGYVAWRGSALMGSLPTEAELGEMRQRWLIVAASSPEADAFSSAMEAALAEIRQFYRKKLNLKYK